MKITKSQLKQIIKEELSKVLNEGWTSSREEAEEEPHGPEEPSVSFVQDPEAARLKEKWEDIKVWMEGETQRNEFGVDLRATQSIIQTLYQKLFPVYQEVFVARRGESPEQVEISGRASEGQPIHKALQVKGEPY